MKTKTTTRTTANAKASKAAKPAARKPITFAKPPPARPKSYEAKLRLIPSAAAASLALTLAEYSGLQDAYDHFNRTLFDAGLPDLMIVFQRRAHSAGHFAPDRFASRIGSSEYHELSLNPDHFIDRSDMQIVSVLVHEMAHVWQQCCGRPPSRGYHDRQWGAKMKAIGLQPSNTGAVGGRETGVQMQHHIIPGGRFEKEFVELAATGWKLNLQSAVRPGSVVTKPNSKTKFTCSNCGQNAWGKPDLAVDCRPCGLPMIASVGLVADLKASKPPAGH